MSRLSLVIPAAVFALLCGLFFIALFYLEDPKKLPSARLGKPVPVFELSNLLAPDEVLRAVDLRSAAAGQPYLINVWATWCPTCRAEHAFLGELADAGVVVHGINYKDDDDAARGWLATLGDPYTLNVSDPEGRLGLDLGVYGAPETFVVDADGIIRYRHVGDVNARNFASTLGPMLRQLGWQG